MKIFVVKTLLPAGKQLLGLPILCQTLIPKNLSAKQLPAATTQNYYTQAASLLISTPGSVVGLNVFYHLPQKAADDYLLNTVRVKFCAHKQLRLAQHKVNNLRRIAGIHR